MSRRGRGRWPERRRIAVVACWLGSAWLLAGPSGPAFGQTCTPVPSGPVSWYRGENNAVDSAGTNHGTLQDGLTFAPGTVGQGFSSTGAGEHILVGNPPNLQLQDFTIDAWIKVDSLAFSNPGHGIVSYGVGGYGFALGPAVSGGGGLNPIGPGELFLTKVGANGVSSQGMAISDTN
jgi:hypothetical protein